MYIVETNKCKRRFLLSPPESWTWEVQAWYWSCSIVPHRWSWEWISPCSLWRCPQSCSARPSGRRSSPSHWGSGAVGRQSYPCHHDPVIWGLNSLTQIVINVYFFTHVGSITSCELECLPHISSTNLLSVLRVSLLGSSRRSFSTLYTLDLTICWDNFSTISLLIIVCSRILPCSCCKWSERETGCSRWQSMWSQKTQGLAFHSIWLEPVKAGSHYWILSQSLTIEKIKNPNLCHLRCKSWNRPHPSIGR